MRAFVAFLAAACVALANGPAAAQDAETLRKELEQLRGQFESTKDQYQRVCPRRSARGGR